MALVNLNQTSTVQFERLPIFGIVAYSEDASSKFKIPLKFDEYVGVLINVASFETPCKSYHVLPVPEYELKLPESK